MMSLRPYLKADVLRVFEPHGFVPAQEIAACRKRMEEALWSLSDMPRPPSSTGRHPERPKGVEGS